MKSYITVAANYRVLIYGLSIFIETEESSPATVPFRNWESPLSDSNQFCIILAQLQNWLYKSYVLLYSYSLTIGQLCWALDLESQVGAAEQNYTNRLSKNLVISLSFSSLNNALQRKEKMVYLEPLRGTCWHYHKVLHKTKNPQVP